MVVCPVKGTYISLQILLLKIAKGMSKLASQTLFAIAKCLYLFQITQFLSEIFIFLSKYNMVTTTIIGTYHHEVNSA